MEDDFRIIISVNKRCEGSKGATGLHDLFKENLEELGPPDPNWFTKDLSEVSSVNTGNDKKLSEYNEISSNGSSSTDEDGISASVRNLLKLLVKRASSHPHRETSCAGDDGSASASDEEKTLGADESWSSSMATPSKSHPLLNDDHHSPDIHSNLESSEVHDDDASVGELLLDRSSWNEGKLDDCEPEFVFYGFEDPVVDRQINSHSVERDLNIDSLYLKSRSRYYANAFETTCYLNFLISLIRESDHVKKAVAVETCVSEPSENGCFLASVFGNREDGDSSKLASFVGGINDNHESSSRPDCSRAKPSIRRSDLNALHSNEIVNEVNVSMICREAEETCRMNCLDGVNLSPVYPSKTLIQIETSELESVAENVDVIDESLVIGPVVRVCSPSLEKSAIFSTPLELDIQCMNRMEMAGYHDGVQAGIVESGNVDCLLNPEKSTTCSADSACEKSCVELDGARNATDEPEYVTQILNLLCSPINASNGHKERKQKGDDSEEKEKNRREKESFLIVRELLEELVENIQNKLGEVNINPVVPSCNMTYVGNSGQVYIGDNVKSTSQVPKCGGMINGVEGENFEERSLEILDEELMKNAFLNISFPSEGDHHSDVCITVENINQKSPCQRLLIDSSKEVNDAVTSCSTVTGLNYMVHTSIPVAALAEGELSSCSKSEERKSHSCSLAYRSQPSNSHSILEESVEIKMEPESDREQNYLGSQDFLSCSVLEEVCQASEALAYAGRMKTDCLMVQKNSNNLKSPGVNPELSQEKVVVDHNLFADRDDWERKILCEGEIANCCNGDPSKSRNSILSYDEEKSDLFVSETANVFPGREEHHSHQGRKDSSEKSVKEKMVFTVPVCGELIEFENDLNTEVCPEIVMESQSKCENLSPSNVVSRCSEEAEKCVESITCEGSIQFIYPKQRNQSGPLVLKGVSPEDLMSRAAQLEKYSSLVSNSGKSSLTRLKMGSLVSFSCLESTGSDHSAVIENKVMGNRKKSISMEGQPLLEKDSSCKVVKHCDFSGEIQVNILSCNAESRAMTEQVDGSKELEKDVALSQKTNTLEILAEPKMTQLTEEEELKLVAEVNECLLSMEVSGPEKNVPVDERAEICTSPILSKKFRAKKPFRRRNKNHTSTPEAKAKFVKGMKEHKENPVLLGGKIKCMENMKSNDEVGGEKYECNVVAEDSVGNEKCVVTKFCASSPVSQKECVVEFSEKVGVGEEIVHLPKHESLFSKNVHCEKFHLVEGIGLKASPENGKEKEVLSKSLRNVNKYCSKYSISNRSTRTNEFSTASLKKTLTSESAINAAKKICSGDHQSLEADNESALPNSYEDKLLTSDNSLFKENIPSSKNTSPCREDIFRCSSPCRQKECTYKHSVTHAKISFAEDVKKSEGIDNFHALSAIEEKVDVSVKSKSLLCEDSTPCQTQSDAFNSVYGEEFLISEKHLSDVVESFAEDLSVYKGGNDFGHPQNEILAEANETSSKDSSLRLETFKLKSDSSQKASSTEHFIDETKERVTKSGESLGCSENIDIIRECKNDLRVSAKSLLKARILACKNSTPGQTAFPGFLSASGKKISVSEKSLSHAKKLFAEDFNNLEGGDSLSLSSAGSKKSHGLSRQVLETNILQSEGATPVRSNVGFSTASGRKVAISGSSLNRARKLFSEDMGSLKSVNDIGDLIDNGEKISSKSILEERTLPSEESTPVQTAFPGFSSASGKKISISEKSLAHAKKLFAEDPLNPLECGSGSSSAYLKKISSFSKPLSKAGMPNSEDSTPVKSDIGFSTASGRKGAVLESSLRKSRKLYSEDMDPLKSVNDISSKGKVNTVIKSVVEENMPCNVDSTPVQTAFPGFSSASGKRISISEKSLAHAKKLFAEDLNPSEGGDNLGVSSASQKSIGGLSKPLLKACMPLSEDSTPIRPAVGFSTASGRKVVISESSLNRARKLFSEDMGSLKSVNDVGVLRNNRGKLENSSNSAVKENNLTHEDSTPVRTTFPGFSSASGKMISISEKSLAHAKKVFGEDFSTLEGGCRLDLSSASGKNLDSVSKPVLKTNMPRIEDSTPIRSDVGFSTASGRKVAVSESSLNRARQLFSEDIDPMKSDNNIGVPTTSGVKVNISSKSAVEEKLPCNVDSTPVQTAFPGFSSASGKRISISEKSLAHAKKLFAEDLNPLECGNGSSSSYLKKIDSFSKPMLKASMPHSEDSTPVRSDAGLSTASGRKVAVSESSLNMARKLFSEDIDPLKSDNNIGVPTTSGVKVNISSKSAVEEKMPSNVDSTPVQTAFPGFSSASGKRISISEKSLAHAKKLFAEDLNPLECGNGSSSSYLKKIDSFSKPMLKASMPHSEDSTPVRSDAGLSTASGRKVAVSESSLNMARKLFSEDIDPLKSDNNIGVPTTSGVKVNISSKSAVEEKMPCNVDSTPVQTAFPGFSSASGKRISISEKSLAHAKKLFAEDLNPLECGNGSSSSYLKKIDSFSKPMLKDSLNPFGTPFMPNSEDSTPVRSDAGLSTASGRKVAVAESSLNRARKLFSEDIDPLKSDNNIGVPTTGGVKVDISSKSAVEEKVPRNVDSTPVQTGFPGFSSASGKRISISEKSLAHAKKLFAEDFYTFEGGNKSSSANLNKIDGILKPVLKDVIPHSEDSSPVRSAVGLSTPSGREVDVTESSLSKAKKLFSEDLDPLKTVNDTGVPMARGGKVDISSKSVVKEMTLSHEKSTPGQAEFLGFSSASGKKISVSEKALAHAKKLFAEDVNPVGNENFSGDSTPVDPHLDSGPVSYCHGLMQSKSNMSFSSDSNKLANKKTPNTASTLPSHSLVVNEKGLKCKDLPPNHVGKPSHPSSLIMVKESEDPDLPVSPSGSSLLKNNVKDFPINIEDQFHDSKEHGIAAPQDVFLAESQGDDYIKAVDTAVLNSVLSVSLVDQNPPSPVFKTTKKRRRKWKGCAKKQKADGGLGKHMQSNLGHKTSISGGSDGLDGKSDSLQSSQSSVMTQEQEFCDKGKYSELWDGDVADESWLGKQLEFAEESGLGDKSGVVIDHWAEGRKLQKELISSKENVKPIIGHYLQSRRGMGQQRRSLKDFVKGKRPGRYSKDQLRKYGVQEETMSITSINAADFRFKLQDHYQECRRSDGVLVNEGFRLIPDERGMFGVTEAQSALLAAPGVDPKLLPADNWCRNHYRWIVWKLASYEKSFPQDFGGRCLTPENVICQLKYRWDREIDCGERSAIRKILEKDDTASKRMILCVSGLKTPALPGSSKNLELDLATNSCLLELTDGWYCISGIVDSELAHLTQRGHLPVGSKIVTTGAELINGPPNGCSPFEPQAEAARIQLFANSTRRARWDAKLGFVCNHPGPLPVPLYSLLPGGGAVGVLNNVLLARVYPIVSIEKTADGRRVVRSKRAEARAVAKYEFERQAWLESVYAEVSAEMQREQDEEAARRQRSKRALTDGSDGGRSFKRPRRGHCIYGGSGKSSIRDSLGEMIPVEELSRLVDESEDPSEVQKLLTTSQVEMISAYRQESRDRFQKELEERVRRKIREEEEKLKSCENNQGSMDERSSAGRKNRDVVSMLKVRLVDADRPIIAKSAVLTIWTPSEDVISLLAKEGSILSIFGLNAKGMRSNFIQLSSGKHTKFKLKKSPVLMESCYPNLRREILSQGFDDYEFNSGKCCNSPLPPFGEIDLIAMVIRVGEEPDKAKGHGFQQVYVAGSDGSLLSITFWGGIQEFAVEEFLQPGSVITVLNLQLRRLHGLHRIATAQAVETSVFTLNPVEERLKRALSNFKAEIEAEKELQLNGVEFIQSCEQKLDAVLGFECKEVSPIHCPKEMTPRGAKSLLPPLLAPTSGENIGSMKPSVAARMKKLQMYEGSPEISLPTCHLRKSTSVVKAFHPPKKYAASHNPSSHESKSVGEGAKSCQSPQGFDSDVKTENVALNVNKNVQFIDADSPPMSLDSDPQE